MPDFSKVVVDGKRLLHLTQATVSRGFNSFIVWVRCKTPMAKGVFAFINSVAVIPMLVIGFIALQDSREANVLSKVQANVGFAGTEARLTVVALDPVQRFYLHNSPAAFAPRLKIVSGIVNGPVSSTTICSHASTYERENDRRGTITSIYLIPNEEKDGDVCEYQMISENYSGNEYELERRIYGTVHFRDNLSREYLYSWCRYYIRGRPLPWPPNPQLAICRDETKIITSR